MAGHPEVTNTTYLAAAVLCIGAIGALSDQKTARIGNTLGLLGVSTGIAATLGGIGGSPELYAQIGGKYRALSLKPQCLSPGC